MPHVILIRFRPPPPPYANSMKRSISHGILGFSCTGMLSDRLTTPSEKALPLCFPPRKKSISPPRMKARPARWNGANSSRPTSTAWWTSTKPTPAPAMASRKSPPLPTPNTPPLAPGRRSYGWAAKMPGRSGTTASWCSAATNIIAAYASTNTSSTSILPRAATPFS